MLRLDEARLDEAERATDGRGLPEISDLSRLAALSEMIADTDQENCQKRGAAANRYAGMQNGPVTAGGDGPGQGVMGVCWSGSLVVCGDGDGYAECFELADVVADLLVLAGAVAVVVLAEVAVAGPGV